MKRPKIKWTEEEKDVLLENFISAIILLKQTTEFEVLDTYKIKVLEFEKLLEETLIQPLTITLSIVAVIERTKQCFD